MSVSAVAWALQQPIEDAATKLLLVVLADFADDQNACWPSQGLLADRVGNCSLDTIQRRLKRLEADGFIWREKRYLQNGHRSSNRYVLRAPKLNRNQRPSKPRTKPHSCAVDTKPQPAAKTKPHPIAVQTKPQIGAVTRTTKVEPPIVFPTRLGKGNLGGMVVEDTGADGWPPLRGSWVDDEVPV